MRTCIHCNQETKFYLERYKVRMCEDCRQEVINFSDELYNLITVSDFLDLQPRGCPNEKKRIR